MCDLDFDEYATVWDERLITRARKEHRCDTCAGPIASGASYVAHFSVTAGDATHEKQCLRCRTISDAFRREHGSSVNPGSLLDFLEQCLDEERWAVDEDDDADDYDGGTVIMGQAAAAPVRLDQLPSRLSDEGLRWKHAMAEIRARRHATMETAAW